MTMVGRTPCSIDPSILNTSPANHTTMNTIERPSADCRRKFSTICGEKTTTQQAIEIDLSLISQKTLAQWHGSVAYPQMPLRASMSRVVDCEGGNMSPPQSFTTNERHRAVSKGTHGSLCQVSSSGEWILVQKKWGETKESENPGKFTHL